MKKLYRLLASGLICITIGVSLCACGNSKSTSISNNDSSQNSTVDTEDKSEFGEWSVGDYVDEFGDSTGSTFCYTICDGTFENSATAGSELAAGVYYDPSHNAFLFRLLEYKDSYATYLSSDDISMKCKVGEYVFEDTLVGNAPNGALFLTKSNDSYGDSYEKLYKYLNEGEEIRTVIYIGNSKYSFTINGNGFKEAIVAQEKKQDTIGISGTYKNASITGKYADWFIIKAQTSTSGTITAASNSGSATLDYTYDPSTYTLTVVPNSDWEYRCSYDSFIVNDVVLFPHYGTCEGQIPNEGLFDAKIKLSTPGSQATSIYEFSKDGSFIKSGTDYKGEKDETESGTYTIKDSFLFEKYSNGVVLVNYIFDGKLYPAYRGVYVIDK